MLVLASVSDSLVSVATQLVHELGLAGVFVLMVLESACVPIPSEATMMLAGFNVAQGHWSLLEITVAGVVGNLVGSWIAYAVGYCGRIGLLERYGRVLHITERRLRAADRWFERFGAPAVFFSRLLPVIRTFISLPAGAARMPFWRFTLYTVAGSIPWVLLLGFAGQQVGHNWPTWRHNLGYLDYAVVVAVVLGAVYLAARWWTNRRRRTAVTVGVD